MKTISFEFNTWGHAIHGDTLKREEPMFADGLFNRRRYSVLAHSMDKPQAGDLIKYRVHGGVATAKVYKVHALGDPDDMFKIYFFRDRSIDKKYNAIC